MNNETFNQEIGMCQKLSKENGGHCNWGECDKCGVIPLLHKLNKGTYYEDQDEIKKLKHDILS